MCITYKLVRSGRYRYISGEVSEDDTSDDNDDNLGIDGGDEDGDDGLFYEPLMGAALE